MTDDQAPAFEVVRVDNNARGPLGSGWGSGYGIADPGRHGLADLWSSDGKTPAIWATEDAAEQNARHCAHLYPDRVKGAVR
jgi:hypothetical protein